MHNPGHRFQAQDRFADGAQYIAGRLAKGTSGRRHAVVDPATGDEVYTYELAGTADVDAAVAAARAAFPGWAGATPANGPTPCTASPPYWPTAPRSSPGPSPPVRQAAETHPGVRRPRDHRQHRVLRGRGPASPGAVGGRVLR